jgi:CobQ-like glutamine amidotransferase family enzyme
VTQARRRLRLAQLYPLEMSIYGDRGNILALKYRAEQRGVDVEVVEVGRGRVDLGGVDIFFLGGGQDLDQELVARDLVEHKRAPVAEAVAAGAVFLAVCGGYQLLGSHYTAVNGKRLEGIGLLDLHTEAGERRMIGNVVLDAAPLGLDPTTIVGFENHAGRTFLGEGLNPLGRCMVGSGNNGDDGNEGVCAGTIVGTYVHGSLLPKNPQLTDHLLRLGLRRLDPAAELEPLDATAELRAHHAMTTRILREGALADR